MKFIKPLQILLGFALFSICLLFSCNQNVKERSMNESPINLVAEDKTTTNQITYYYLIRHAEKLSDDQDPHLSEAGLERAKELARMLNDVNLQAIYSTNYYRTKETVADIAANKSLQIEEYNPRDLKGFVSDLSSKYTNGEHVLIVGHSNSTPTLANELVQREVYQQFDEKHYDNLIIVASPNEGIPTSTRLHFGAQSPE